jgi:hypothetical protein
MPLLAPVTKMLDVLDMTVSIANVLGHLSPETDEKLAECKRVSARWRVGGLDEEGSPRSAEG